jgi:hypothetical protein
MPEPECIEEKKALNVWKRVGIVTSTILGVIALLTVVYKLDSYNIRVTSDPVYAKNRTAEKSIKHAAADTQGRV